MSVAHLFRSLWDTVHTHYNPDAAEKFVQELETLESRLAIVEQLVKSVVPGLAPLPDLPVLDPAAVGHEDQAVTAEAAPRE